MLIQALTQVKEQYDGDNPLFLRILLKEYIQNYILNFVYTSSLYKEMLFTGGTCLRKVYGLNRLSEDLDFNYEGNFSIEDFSNSLKSYLETSLDFYDLRMKLSNNDRSLIIKFDILGKIGLTKTPVDTRSLFVRCDFALEDTGVYGEDVKSISTPQFTFFARCYDLETLYANKLVAFLNRSFFKMGSQDVPFKGRDVYDLVWFKERSLKEDFFPNEARLQTLLGLERAQQVWAEVSKKIALIEPDAVYKDILPFLPSKTVAREYALNFKKILLD